MGQAVTNYKNGEGTFEALAEEYEIPVTSYRKVKRIHLKTPSGQTTSYRVNETAIVNFIAIIFWWERPWNVIL